MQPSAPVTSVVFERSSGQLSIDLAEKVRELRRFMDLLKICDEYGGTLERFEEGGLERLKRSNLTSDRADRAVFELATRLVSGTGQPGRGPFQVQAAEDPYYSGEDRPGDGRPPCSPDQGEPLPALLEEERAPEKGQFLTSVPHPYIQTSWKRSEITSLAIDFDWLRGLARDYEKCEEAISQLCGGHVCLLADKRYMDYFQ